MGRIPPHPEASQFDLQRILEALVDPVRRSIITQLDASDEDIKCGAFDIQVSKSTATHHFKVLREAGLIEQRSEGTRRVNTLRRDDLEARFPGVLSTILDAA
jgi:DNA-binding transcriptional ArsR family regulator